MELVRFLSKIDQILDQILLRNPLSRFEIIDLGTQKCTHTFSKKRLAVYYVVILFLQAARMTILENLSTTMKIFVEKFNKIHM